MIFNQNQVNLHTHSFYCKHGTGTIAEYVKQAESDGLNVLGFSEHCPLPDKNYCTEERMDYDEMPLYENDVLKAQKESSIKILLGAECDWLPEEKSFYKDELLGHRKYDYLICAIHNIIDPKTDKFSYLGHFEDLSVKDLSDYVKDYTEGLSSEIFLFGGHPDLIFTGYRNWDKNAVSASMDIIRCAVQYKIPLEINDYGLRKKQIKAGENIRPPYPVRQFWELAATEGVKIIANSDAHRAQDVAAHKDRATEFAKKLGISFASYEITETNRISIN